MIQVYCNDENGINKWLKENHNLVDIIDVKIAMNNDGEWIMVVYKKLRSE
ncbi:hypothetical protein [Lysinibacillus sp. G4S2]|nr:hypothetical protein [Lysinibacillus sp. G4S2]MDM5245724.1 hypothetical protein [Lysinibacillus sp. G4S2]